MLYALHEMRHALLAPWNTVAAAQRDLLTNPFSPFAYLPSSRRIAAGFDLFCRFTQRYEQPEFGLTTAVVGGREVAVEERVAVDKPFCRLHPFPARRGAEHDPAVLLVAPLSGHHATLLRDTVRALLPDHEVYITDWVDASMVPLAQGRLHLDDYVDYMREFIRFLGPEAHVISVCQPTVPVLAAVSLMAAAGEDVPRTMMMMGGPIDARRSPTAVNNLATPAAAQLVRAHVIQRVPVKYPGCMRRVYPGFLQHLGFVAMNPSRHADAHWDYYNHLRPRRRRQRGRASPVLRRVQRRARHAGGVLPRHHPEGVPGARPAEGPLQRARRAGAAGRDLEDRAADDRRRARRHLRQRPDRGGARAVHRHPGQAAQHYLVPAVGHYGIFSGRRWREAIAPRIHDFIRRHG